MFKQFEIILTIVFTALSAVLLFFIIWRLRSLFFKRKARISIWNKKVGMHYRAAKIFLAAVRPSLNACKLNASVPGGILLTN